MCKCEKCSITLEPNTLKCKCGAIIQTETVIIEKETFIKKLLRKDLTKVLAVVLAFIVLSTGGAIIVSEIMERI